MTTDKLNQRLLVAALIGSAALGLAGQALAYDVYHGVQAHPATGIVIWTNASFGVSGGPVPPPPAPPPVPNLSFFYFATDVGAQAGLPAAQCILKVHLANTGPAPAVNANDTVGNVAVAIVHAAARPFPWTIVFDNVPPSHWNITKGEIVNLAHVPAPSNATAGTVAALGFHNLATNPGNTYGVTVINGTLHNCQP